MKISFQIIHNYQTEPLKVIGNALHLTLNEDLIISNEFSTAIENVNIKLNKILNCGDTICYFELDVTEYTIYDEFKHNEFIDNFVSRLKSENGFIKVLKFNDDLRLNDYLEIYKDISTIEMQIREIFSYIFYSKYDDKSQDILEEFEVKIVNKEDVRKDDLEKKLENKFFYLTFSEYLKFDTPKDIPTKEVLPLIMNNSSYDLLRTYVSSRGIIQTNHLSFLRNVKTLLDPIESVRNCVAHNRKIPKNQFDNYPEAKQKLLEFIDNFWNEEVEFSNEVFQMTSFEQGINIKLIFLLVNAVWDVEKSTVRVLDFFIQDTPSYTFSNILDFRNYLIDTLKNDAVLSYSIKDKPIELLDDEFNAIKLVDKILNEYKKELIILGWI